MDNGNIETKEDNCLTKANGNVKSQSSEMDITTDTASDPSALDKYISKHGRIGKQ